MHGAAYKNLPGAVKFLADKGAKIDIWNTRNKFGWTPLTIARGYRFGNFKPSAVTVAAIEQVMLAAGVVPPTKRKKTRRDTTSTPKPWQLSGSDASSPLRIAKIQYGHGSFGFDTIGTNLTSIVRF